MAHSATRGAIGPMRMRIRISPFIASLYHSTRRLLESSQVYSDASPFQARQMQFTQAKSFRPLYSRPRLSNGTVRPCRLAVRPPGSPPAQKIQNKSTPSNAIRSPVGSTLTFCSLLVAMVRSVLLALCVYHPAWLVWYGCCLAWRLWQLLFEFRPSASPL